MEKRPTHILPVIVFSQFTGTSLWFAGNAVIGELQIQWNLPAGALGYLTSAVQLGFITGALVFAFFALSDRFRPRYIFLACSLLGAMANLSILWMNGTLVGLLLARFATGFFLAGIYPIGMKIAASWYAEGLGKALGFLVGALVLGTAFPHLIKGMGAELSWRMVMALCSSAAIIGGLLLALSVKDGPFLPEKPPPFDPGAIRDMFRKADFRAASFGYFGHMWELYALWAFIPVILQAYATHHSLDINLSLWSFSMIAIGFFGCSVGGYLSLMLGNAVVARAQLITSGLCCLISPILFYMHPFIYFGMMFIWGICVIGDSPQFSTLTAKTAPRERVGSALTIVNCMGFAITIFSIQLLNYLSQRLGAQWLSVVLAVGPVFGLISMRPLLKKRA